MQVVLRTVTALVPLVALGCNSSSTPSGKPITPADVRQKLGAAAETVGQYAAQTKDEFVVELKKRLDQLDGQLAELKAKLNQATAEAKPELQKRIDELGKKREDYAKKIEQVKESSGDAWKELRDGLNKAWDELSTGVRNAFEKLNK